MVIVHRGGVGRTSTGGRRVATRGKRKFEKGSRPTETLLDKTTKIIVADGKFGLIKSRVLKTDKVNLLDPKSKSFSKTTIKSVLECPANRHYARRNILVKGTIVDTEKGKARITSRPGQHGTVNAVLI